MPNYFIHETSVIDQNVEIGEGTKIWHFCHVMSHSIIGKHSSLGQNVFVGENVIIGNNVKIQNNVSLYTGIICEDDVFIGPSAVFTNVINPRSFVSRKNEFKKTVIGKGATIGANATIVCGNNIGAFSFVGAGSIVTKDVEPYSLVMGNPAKHRGWISEYGHKLTFGTDDKAICKESGQVYQLKNGRVARIL